MSPVIDSSFSFHVHSRMRSRLSIPTRSFLSHLLFSHLWSFQELLAPQLRQPCHEPGDILGGLRCSALVEAFEKLCMLSGTLCIPLNRNKCVHNQSDRKLQGTSQCHTKPEQSKTQSGQKQRQYGWTPWGPASKSRFIVQLNTETFHTHIVNKAGHEQSQEKPQHGEAQRDPLRKNKIHCQMFFKKKKNSRK